MSQQASNSTPDKKQPFSWKGAILNFFLVILIMGIGVSLNSIMEYFKVARFVEELELKTYDLRTSLRIGPPKMSADPHTMIVKFDDLTLNLFENEYGTWPWPRQVHSDIIDYMERAGVRMIAFDLMFSGRQKGQQVSDDALINTFAKYKNVYFSMNFDNNLDLYRQAGQDLTPEMVASIMPYSIPVSNSLSQENTALQLDHTGFYVNSAMTFNHFRMLMPELMGVKQRIAFINHGRDMDGISRGNPLLFRFMYKHPVYSHDLPVKEIRSKDGKTVHYVDQKGQPVDKAGILLKNYQEPIEVTENSFYPYLGLRMLLDLKYPNKKIKFTLTPDGELKFANYKIPLSQNGNYLVNWYNYNYDVEQAQNFITIQGPKIVAFEHELNDNPKARTAENLHHLKLAQEALKRANDILQNPFLNPAPFPEISASHILVAIKNEKLGKETEKDRQLKAFLKNKIIFVGTTALATYDIKSTPISAMMPGLLIQAHIFDNLLQNKMYISRLTPAMHLGIMFALSLLSAVTTFKFRSANAGFLTSVTIGLTYVVVVVALFKELGIWVNIVMPIIVIVITTTLSFMAKYISRDRDYKRTYILATTDSMTGLHNHRYFKEQMINNIERCKRNNSKFSLVLIDIDFFKKFNDNYGHQAGDEVLRCVARKLKNSVRNVDVVARYGGEEMAIILDRANEKEALDVAQKIVTAIASEAYPIAPGVAKNVTISVGVSTYPTHAETVDDMIEFSDKGLYRAKENGRNQVGAQYDTEQAEKEQPGNPFSPKAKDSHKH